MAQIEPIEISGKEGVYLKVYTFPFSSPDRMRGEILDKYDNVLFSSVVTAKTIDDVVYQLGLTLIK